jgi:outer membrane protein assembly factor BamB
MDPIVDASCRRIAGILLRAFAVVAAIAAIGRIAIDADAQVAMKITASGVTEIDSDDPSNAPKGFAVLKADRKVIESIEDFNRYCGKKSWELAFHALNSIDEGSNHGLVPAGDGLMVPIRDRVDQCLMRLPPEGRDAYRLFNDANARQLWDHLRNAHGAVPADELITLRKLVDRYFLTSVADLAADRLGDALFEQGDFAGAERMWRLVVEKYPDSHLSIAKLQAKRCVALSQLGRRDALAAIVADLHEKYADQTATIGGREVNAAEFAESLVSRTAAPQPARTDDAEEMALPKSNEPSWQLRFVDSDLLSVIDPQTGMPLGASNFRTAPGTAVDDKRFYANWLGTVYATDLETGKLVWRSDPFAGTLQEIREILQQGMSPESFFLVAAGGKLLAGRRPVRNAQGQFGGSPMPENNTWHMDWLDPVTGKTLWTARDLEATIISPPFVLHDIAYVIGLGQDNATMQLLAIGIATGQVQWRLPLGTPQNANNFRGGFGFGGGKMLAVGGSLYVATNNGALLAVDVSGHEIQWALQHDTRPFSDNQNFWWNGMVVSPSDSPETLIFRDGTLYLKDGGARLLYALDPAEPAVQWKRPLSGDEAIVAIKGQVAFLLGSDLSALDLKSRKLLWSTKIPGENLTLRPLVCPGHIFVPTARGVFDLDPASGDTRGSFRGADRDSRTSRLILAGDKLIAISDVAVTAYKIERAKSTHAKTAVDP